MLINVSVQYPPTLAATSDRRATFRKTMENRLRPRFAKAVEDCKSEGTYKAIAEGYRYEQKSAGDLLSFAVINDNPHSQYLIGGTSAHEITQPAHVAPLAPLLEWADRIGKGPAVAYAAQRKIASVGTTVRHPGDRPDVGVQKVMAALEDQTLSVVVDGTARWLARNGAEEA